MAPSDEILLAIASSIPLHVTGRHLAQARRCLQRLFDGKQRLRLLDALADDSDELVAANSTSPVAF